MSVCASIIFSIFSFSNSSNIYFLSVILDYAFLIYMAVDILLMGLS